MAASLVSFVADPLGIIPQANIAANVATNILNQATGYTDQNQVVVVGAQYCATSPMDLIIQKLAFSSYEIRNIDGNIVFKVKAEFPYYYKGRKVFSDANGVPVLSMQPKLTSVHKRWEVYKGNSKDPRDIIFSVKQPSVVQLMTELDVYLIDNRAENVCDYKAKGSLVGRSCTIYKGETNTIISQNHQKHNVQSLVLGRNTFMVTVYPQVDHAFIAALVVILDTMAY